MAHPATSRDPDRRPLLVMGVGALLLVAVGSVNAATVTVASVNFTFQPETRTVNEGDTVRWTFAGDPHTVTSGAPGSPDGRFDSGVKDPGGSFQFTFDSAGTFPYYCQIHPEQMFGTIVVAAEPAPTPTARATPTPRPTAPPTPRPTPAPTPRPTPRPTATPTAAPTAAPTTSPTAAATPSPTASASTVSPGPSPSSAAASASPGASPSASATPETSPVPNPSDIAAGLDPLPIIAVGILVGLVVAGGVTLLRRTPTRRPPDR